MVAAPSKLIRPCGDRVKTDTRDALLLAAQEAARDVVRARDDCRTDLMRTRNRLSKFLSRQGVGDWSRFTGNTIGAYLGLVPTESSSGATGSKAG